MIERQPSPSARLEVRRAVLDRLRAAHGLLHSLSDPAFEAMRDHLVPEEIAADQVLLSHQAPPQSVYFPFSGLYAIIRYLQDGSSIQVALAENAGALGFTALDDPAGNVLEVRAMIGGWTLGISSSVLSSLMQAHPQIRSQFGPLSQALIAQISLTAACNARHLVQERVAHWLMTASDCLNAMEIRVTQECIATLLGARRASISEALGRLSAAGVVTTARHAILIRDRNRLQNSACSCYEEGLAWRATQPAGRARIASDLPSNLPSLMRSWSTGEI